MKTKKMPFLSKFISIIYPLRVSNRVTSHRQEAVIVCAAYGAYTVTASTIYAA